MIPSDSNLEKSIQTNILKTFQKHENFLRGRIQKTMLPEQVQFVLLIFQRSFSFVE